MKGMEEGTPVSPALEQLIRKKAIIRSSPVNRRVFYLGIQAIINAIIIGILAKMLVLLITLITNLAFYGKLSLFYRSPAGNHMGWVVIMIPIVGSVLVGLMARYGSKGIRGHGIPEAMEKIIMDDSRIPPVITFLKPLSAAISIGTGGPFGAEGPIIATGGALGSLTGQVMHISPAERKIILAAGACAGMSAIFGSPLAAILLAIELLLFEFSPRSIIPVSLACIAGDGMHMLLFDQGPVFIMPAIPVPSTSALTIYLLSGALIGVIASLISRSVYAVEDGFEKIPVHWMWWPAIGAIAVGVIGYFSPRTMGVGYENISDLLKGNLSLSILFSLFIMKFLSWVISLGSGTSGGTLAPLFTIGGGLGALLGMLLLTLFPSLDINLPTFALVGMAAMFAGASRAFLTSVVFALETTGQINGLLPLLGACSSAYFVSFFLMKGSIMTEKIKRRGIRTPEAYVPDVLQNTNAGELVTAIPPGTGNLPYVYASDDAGLAAEIIGKYGLEAVLVMDNKENKQPMGVITATSLLKFYSEQRQKEHSYDSPTRTRKIMVQGRKWIKNLKM